MNDIQLTPDFKIKDPWDLQKTVESCDITLEQLFRIVAEIEEQCPGFALYCGMANFNEFFDEIEKEDIDKKDINYLELYWDFDYDLRVIKGKEQQKKTWGKHEEDPARGVMYNLMGFHGVGKCPEDCKGNQELPPDYESGYAIEFSPLQEIKFLKIKISPTAQVRKCHAKIDESENYVKEGFAITIHPTLWTVITSIFFELTFCGSPNQRDEQREEIVGRAEEAKRDIEMGLTDKFIPAEQLFDELDKKLENEDGETDEEEAPD